MTTQQIQQELERLSIRSEMRLHTNHYTKRILMSLGIACSIMNITGNLKKRND